VQAFQGDQDIKTSAINPSKLQRPRSINTIMSSGNEYGPIKKKKSHSKGRAGQYNQSSPPRINQGAASSLLWIDYLISSRDADLYKRIMRNLKDLRRACREPDPDNLQCMLTASHGSDHRRTSTEAFRSMIDAHGDQATAIPLRISVHVLALIEAGWGPPLPPPPRHPTSTKQAFWVASHLCHNKSCTNPDHLIWEPNWANRQRDGCMGGDVCVHVPYKCIRSHRRPEQNVDWTKLM